MKCCLCCGRPMERTEAQTAFEAPGADVVLQCRPCGVMVKPPYRWISDEAWALLLARADSRSRPYELEEHAPPPPKPVKPPPPPPPIPLVPECRAGHAYAEHGRVERSKGQFVCWRCKACAKKQRKERLARYRQVAS